MSQPVLIKVYGNISPFTDSLRLGLAEVCETCLPEAALITTDDNLLLLSFEGIYFPIDEALAAIKGHLTPAMSGKIDYLDLEAWFLTRYTIAAGLISAARAPLNNVLDYSGH